MISQNPTTLQLRYLQTLSEIGVNQNSTIVFPLPWTSSSRSWTPSRRRRAGRAAAQRRARRRGNGAALLAQRDLRSRTPGDARSDKLGRPQWIYSNIRASSCSPATGCRCPAAPPPPPSRRPSRRPTRSVIPASSRRRCRSAAAARPAGSRSRKDRVEAEEHAKAILGMDIKGHTVHEVWIEAASDIAVRVLRVDRLRPLRQAPAGHALHAGRHGHRGGGRHQPGRDRPPARRPAARLPGLPRPPARVRGRRRRRHRAPARRAADQALRRLRQRRGDARRGQPADRDAATARSPRSTRR